MNIRCAMNINIVDCTGWLTRSSKKKFGTSKLGTIYSLLISAFLTWFAIVNYETTKSWLTSGSHVTVCAQWLQFYINNGFSVLIVMANSFQQGKVVRVFNALFDPKVHPQKISDHGEIGRDIFYGVMTTVITIFVHLVTTLTSYFDNSKRIAYYWFPYGILFLLNTMVVLQFLCGVVKVGKKFQALNVRLEDIIIGEKQTFMAKYSYERSADRIDAELNRAAEDHSDLVDKANLLISAFSHQLFLSFVAALTISVTGLYLICKRIIQYTIDAENSFYDNPEKSYDWWCLTCYPLCHSVLLVSIVTVCNWTINQTNLLHGTLPRYQRVLRPSEKSNINGFCHQLLLQRVSFDVFNLFRIDPSIICSIISTVLTYLIILVQFELSQELNLKRRHSWGSEADFRTVEAEAAALGYSSGIHPDHSLLRDEEGISYKENARAVQAVDLVAGCPLPMVTPPSTPVDTARVKKNSTVTPTPRTPSSMGQRPSALLRPKISLTWVLRGQQQPTATASVIPVNTNGISGRGNKERSSKRSVKSVKNKERDKEKEKEKEKQKEKENIDRGDKQETIIAVQRNEKIERLEKAFEKDERLTEKSLRNMSEMLAAESVNKNENCCNKDADKVRRAASEPALAARDSPATPGGREKHRHRRAKRPHKPRPPSRFGYEISDLDAFLTKASIESPANIPVVLSFPSVLYQTQGGTQDEVALPLGTVVNAVFKNQAWLYVQTPHGQEGYVGYAGCLPLGILPQPTRGPCWENSTDVFPRPLGNMTDTEKLRDTRSECGGGRARARRGTRDAVSACGERSVDRLYLRAAANAKTKGSRYTLLVIRNDYEGRGGNTISVTKGDVVALLSGHVNEWFWVRSRDGREGFIPAVIAGHGFL